MWHGRPCSKPHFIRSLSVLQRFSRGSPGPPEDLSFRYLSALNLSHTWNPILQLLSVPERPFFRGSVRFLLPSLTPFLCHLHTWREDLCAGVVCVEGRIQAHCWCLSPPDYSFANNEQRLSFDFIHTMHNSPISFSPQSRSHTVHFDVVRMFAARLFICVFTWLADRQTLESWLNHLFANSTAF